MTKNISISEALEYLDISQTEASKLLDVNVRTIRRWMDNPDEMSGPSKHAISAWCMINKLGLSWRPNSIDIVVKNGDTFELDLDKVCQDIKLLRISGRF